MARRRFRPAPPRRPASRRTALRRDFLRASFASTGLLLLGDTLVACSDDSSTSNGPAGVGGSGSGQGGAGGAGGGGQGGAGGMGVPTTSNIANLGPLGDPDENGVRLPEGFSSRIVARSGEAPVSGSSYLWHAAPDGGALYTTSDGGWIYVSNAELSGNGGVGALRFSAEGEVVDAYSILNGTSRNCAGGPTPWGTWLSCEEVESGEVWECDPTGMQSAIVRPALGVFSHEAVAVDLVANTLYLTEDRSNGRFYRFTPDMLTMDGYPDLSAGQMEVLQVVNGEEGACNWLPLPDPSASNTPTREQVPESTAFDGGEGIWYHDGVMYFTTKGDNRVWAYETATDTLTILYDIDTSPMPILSGVDNVTVSGGGDVLVAEDGGDLEIVAITPGGTLVPIMQLVGHNGSEVTGPVFTPDHQRLYFSSQRGTTGSSSGGITFEISGPFFV